MQVFLQVAVQKPKLIEVAGMYVTDSEYDLFKEMLGWVRNSNFSDFTVNKHNNSVNWVVGNKHRIDNFETLSTEN